jgi:hypothetical protein
MSMAHPPPPPSEQFTHTGHRFVLGYDASTYAIWDRTSPGQPVRRYPRTAEGWAQAWHEYTVWEPQSAPVGGYGPLGAPPPSGAPPGSPYAIDAGKKYTSALVWGIVGLIIGPAAIAALVIGLNARREIAYGGAAPSAASNATAGIVLGIVGIVMWVIGIIYFANQRGF